MKEKRSEISTSTVRAVDRIDVLGLLQRSAPDALIEQTAAARLQPSAYAELTPLPVREELTKIAGQHPELEEVRQIAFQEANAHAELRASDAPIFGPSEHASRIPNGSRELKNYGAIETSSFASLVSPSFTSRRATGPSPSNEVLLSNPLPSIKSRAETLAVSALDPSAASRLSETLGPPVVTSLPSSAIKRHVLTALSPSVEVFLTSVREQARPHWVKATHHADGESMMLSVSLSHQTIDVYRGTTLITSSKVSSGMPGHATKAGVFSILEKQTFHHSNIYSGAPMPWMQRLTRSGTALHGGVVPGYPASHGCIRLPFSFAPRLFQMTTVGENVIVANDRLAPKLIEHPNLFQPLPTPVAFAMAHRERIPQRRSRDASEVAAKDAALPGILAEEGGVTVDVLSTSELVTSDGPEHAPSTTKLASSEDNRRDAPLRILVTRWTQRDQMIGVQYILSSMGYLTPQNFDGTFGKATLTAIKAFQKANGLPENGTFTEDLMKKVYKVAGKGDPLEGHLFVRQGFSHVFDEPIAFRQPDQPLGTHIFTAVKFAPGATKTRWMAISLEGGDSASALDRIEIPDDVRQKISERLTPGSSLIIADTSVDSAILPEGDDFLVWAKDPSVEAEQAKAKQTKHKQAKVVPAKTKQAKATRATTKPWSNENWPHSTRRYDYDHPPGFDRPGLFSRWFSRRQVQGRGPAAESSR